ncbi:siderophore-interacting protein [Saccharomonospora saliphila]|uniref:siderophore-interacting protein n=1 Tax=Saccharomonospora saliphila TaxID=369829 RepID=UPI00036F164C|nr:siderophore-interacting protein [Saccharomonospora saliphila]
MVRTQARRATRSYRLFTVEVRRTVRVSPSFLRVTFTGPDLDLFADNGFDQRIKVVFPLPGQDIDHLEWGADWHERWRALPERERNLMRTYTVRAVRRELCEVDVEFVLHGDGGPASRWAAAARPGDRVGVVGPDARYPGQHKGIGFTPPGGTRTILLAGDETATPAAVSILERLSRHARGEAVLEVPHAGDARPATAPAGMRVTWLARRGAAHGSLLIPTVRDAVARLAVPYLRRRTPLPEPDVDADPLWEVPDPAAAVPTGMFAWLAGESGAIAALRRHLVGQVGLDRASVAFMGYWRLGGAGRAG